MWGSLENINFITFKSIHRRNKLRLKDKTLSTNDKALIAAEQNSIAAQIIRYSRLTMILTFLAAQGNDDFNLLYEHNLVTPEEEGWLKAAMIGTRPLLVVSWISELLDDVLPEQGYDLSESTQNTVLQNILSLRSVYSPMQYHVLLFCLLTLFDFRRQRWYRRNVGLHWQSIALSLCAYSLLDHSDPAIIPRD